MAVQFKDYYEMLGVPKAATADEIRKAFRALARKHHPDMAKKKEKAAAEAKFKEINEAYEVLGDPEKRKKFDTLGADWQSGGGFQPPPGWEQQRGGMPQGGGQEFHFGGTGFSDFFEAFFGGQPGARQGGGGMGDPRMRQQAPRRGQDIEADVMVTLSEAVEGTKKTISFRRSETGPAETFAVKIPPGVHAGQRIRLAGLGAPGPMGGEPGDLYLRVRFAQHPEFRVEGNDLVHEVALTPAQAVLGTDVQVPTMDKPVRLKVPAGTQPGQRFRLRGLGLPKGGGERGDLHIIAEIEIPRALSEKERALWEQLGAA